MATGRYCIQKLVYKHPVTKEEIWEDTKLCSDKPEDLMDFITGSYRIFDTLDHFVYKKR